MMDKYHTELQNLYYMANFTGVHYIINIFRDTP